MKDPIPHLLQIENVENMLWGAFLLGSLGGAIAALAGLLNPIDGLILVGLLILLAALIRLIN